MEIPGTKRDIFELDFLVENYNKRDILTSRDGHIEVLQRLPYSSYLVAYPAFIGEEREIAFEHYKFLKKYNLV